MVSVSLCNAACLDANVDSCCLSATSSVRSTKSSNSRHNTMQVESAFGVSCSCRSRHFPPEFSSFFPNRGLGFACCPAAPPQHTEGERESAGPLPRLPRLPRCTSRNTTRQTPSSRLRHQDLLVLFGPRAHLVRFLLTIELLGA